MDRKYSHRGYQDGGRQEERSKPEARRPADGPRSPKMTGFRELMRCGMCGAAVEVALGGVDVTSTCVGCKGDLRTCKNCVNFDPGARFECRVAITARVPSKTVRNQCQLFTPRKTIEKRTGETRPAADDPKAAFERLFKR
jgi:hypothetical protein